MKLRVENLPDGTTRGAGQGVAAPPSPSPRRGRSSTSTRCRTGRAAPGSTPTRREVFFDNVKVTANQVRSDASRVCDAASARSRSPLALAAAAARRLARPRGRSRHRRLADVGRHARPQHGLEHEGPARRPGTSRRKKNVKWVAALGSQTYGNPVVAGGKVFVGTNNEGLRDPKQAGDRGVLMAFRESDGAVPLADHAREAGRRAASTTGPTRASPRSPLVEGDRLYYVSQPRRADRARHRGLPRRRERRAVQGREADRPSTTATSSGSST